MQVSPSRLLLVPSGQVVSRHMTSVRVAPLRGSSRQVGVGEVGVIDVGVDEIGA